MSGDGRQERGDAAAQGGWADGHGCGNSVDEGRARGYAHEEVGVGAARGGVGGDDGGVARLLAAQVETRGGNPGERVPREDGAEDALGGEAAQVAVGDVRDLVGERERQGVGVGGEGARQADRRHARAAVGERHVPVA